MGEDRMSSPSVLFPTRDTTYYVEREPRFFGDLHLDQIVEAITKEKSEYNLKPFFWRALHDPDAVRYRQEVMRDLENPDLAAAIKTFADKMSAVRRYLTAAADLEWEYHKKGWILEAALAYCEAVTALAHALAAAPLQARGLLAFRNWLDGYLQSETFQSLSSEATQVKQALSEIRYCVVIEGGKFKVKPYEQEEDYSVQVEKTFEKFRQGQVDSCPIRLPERAGMSHIEATILDFVARLFPEPFAALDRFCTRRVPFIDETIRLFDREIQFYIAYLDFIADLKRDGLPFCYPHVSSTEKEEYVEEGFDLALAHFLRRSSKSVVRNDYYLSGSERILVVTGPNQGGKTTFARMFGQVHYLASLGCPVPGRRAQLFLPDMIFTHFERTEHVRNVRSKLEDDLLRIHAMLERASSRSLFVLNEIFSSTSLRDALFLSKEVLHRLVELDTLAVWVTFLGDLATMSEKAVSMVALVDPNDPTIRTFRVVRKEADDLAYAVSLARKHGLTYEQLKERLG